MFEDLTSLGDGAPVLFGGSKVTFVTAALAAAFAPGDRLIVIQDTGNLLHVPRAVGGLATRAVDRAEAAFRLLAEVPDAAITAFFDRFAVNLADDRVWREIAIANDADVAAARADGRSTTRLAASHTMPVARSNTFKVPAPSLKSVAGSSTAAPYG